MGCGVSLLRRSKARVAICPPTEALEERWAQLGGEELEPVLASGAVALLEAQRLTELSEAGGALAPRQALPEKSFGSLDGVKANSTHRYSLRLASVSHCWLQADHPDPRGHNLRLLARALKRLTTDTYSGFAGQWAVFFDFCSLHQNCRDANGEPQQRTFEWLKEERRFASDAVGRYKAEKELFKEALASLGSFYSMPSTLVFMLTGMPPCYDDPAVYTRSGNTASYFDRGWCFCESAWVSLVKDPDMVLDLGKDLGDDRATFHDLWLQCARGRRRPPVLPEAFAKSLKTKSFTNGKTDRPMVKRLYSDTFSKRLGAASKLDYARLGWGPAEAQALATVLFAAPQLAVLSLEDNKIGDEGAAALAKALGSRGAPRLAELDLSYTGIGDAGAEAIAKALLVSAAPQLQKLRLDSNDIGVLGTASIAEALGAGLVPKLAELNLAENEIGDSGVLALADALPGVPKLRDLNVSWHSSVSEEAKVKLRVAWGCRDGGEYGLVASRRRLT